MTQTRGTFPQLNTPRAPKGGKPALPKMPMKMPMKSGGKSGKGGGGGRRGC